MAAAVTLACSLDQDLARHLPVTGTVERVVRAQNGATWQLLRLEQSLLLSGAE